MGRTSREITSAPCAWTTRATRCSTADTSSARAASTVRDFHQFLKKLNLPYFYFGNLNFSICSFAE